MKAVKTTEQTPQGPRTLASDTSMSLSSEQMGGSVSGESESPTRVPARQQRNKTRRRRARRTKTPPFTSLLQNERSGDIMEPSVDGMDNFGGFDDDDDNGTSEAAERAESDT